MANQIQQYLSRISDSITKSTLTSIFNRFSMAGDMRYLTWAEGPVVPATASKGYSPGCEFILTTAALGQCPKWVNVGTAASCLFIPTGPVTGYGLKYAGARGGTNTSATEVISGPGFHNTDIAIAGHIASDDDDYIKSVIVTDDESEILITASADPSTTHGYLWAAVRDRCEPEWDIVYAGQAPSTAAATTAITVTGVLATDIALACYAATDDTDAIEKTVCTANTITVSHSDTSSTGHTINYMVIRPRGTFKPSHYIAFAGKDVATTADAAGIATNDVTITGALATDLAFVVISVNGGTIEIAAATMSAGKLTVQFSADPSTTSKFSYIVLRAY